MATRKGGMQDATNHTRGGGWDMLNGAEDD